MRRIVWATQARKDYREAIGFLAGRDPAAAELLRRRVEDAIDRLSHRSIGRPGRIGDILEKPVTGTSYTIAYALDHGDLRILRIIHQRRNWPEEGWPPG